jgi:hypothetical protein
VKRSAERNAAIRCLHDYIDFLIDNPGVAATDGTDGWTLEIDQRAHAAAEAERRAEVSNAE